MARGSYQDGDVTSKHTHILLVRPRFYPRDITVTCHNNTVIIQIYIYKDKEIDRQRETETEKQRQERERDKLREKEIHEGMKGFLHATMIDSQLYS